MKSSTPIIIKYTGKDFLETNSSNIEKAIEDNMNKQKEWNRKKWARTENERKQFKQKLFDYILFAEFGVFKRLFNLSKTIGEKYIEHRIEYSAKMLKMEYVELQKMVELFQDQQEIMEEMREEGIISDEEYNDKNLQFASFLACKDLELSKEGIDIGLKEKFEVKIGDIQTDLLEIYQKQSDSCNTGFFSVVLHGIEKLTGNEVEPSQKVLEVLNDMSEQIKERRGISKKEEQQSEDNIVESNNQNTQSHIRRR